MLRKRDGCDPHLFRKRKRNKIHHELLGRTDIRARVLRFARPSASYPHADGRGTRRAGGTMLDRYQDGNGSAMRWPLGWSASTINKERPSSVRPACDGSGTEISSRSLSRRVTRVTVAAVTFSRRREISATPSFLIAAARLSSDGFLAPRAAAHFARSASRLQKMTQSSCAL